MIHLHAGPVINTLPPIVDPDPLLSCDLMDGRDAFLTLARDKHWEFSSLRRSKWSTLCMLVELHTQGQDRFVYTCNECKHHVETRWHCTVCEVGPRAGERRVLGCSGFLRGSACRCHTGLRPVPGVKSRAEWDGPASQIFMVELKGLSQRGLWDPSRIHAMFLNDSNLGELTAPVSPPGLRFVYHLL